MELVNLLVDWCSWLREGAIGGLLWTG